MSATDNLRETLTSITNTGLISIEDCPTEELDPVFERENVHRVVREEEIVSGHCFGRDRQCRKK